MICCEVAAGFGELATVGGVAVSRSSTCWANEGEVALNAVCCCIGDVGGVGLLMDVMEAIDCVSGLAV